jgi:hypothetical protein
MTLPVFALVPTPIEGLGDDPELDDEVPGEILRFDLPALLPPQPQQRGLILPQHDPRV